MNDKLDFQLNENRIDENAIRLNELSTFNIVSQNLNISLEIKQLQL